MIFELLKDKFGHVVTPNSAELVASKHVDLTSLDTFDGTYHEFLLEHDIHIPDVAERLFIEFDFEYNFDGTVVRYQFDADGYQILLAFNRAEKTYSVFTTDDVIDPVTHLLVHYFLKHNGFFDELEMFGE